MTTRILVADDHQMMRQGLRAFLDKQDGFKVIGEAENGREAVAQALKLAPHVVVMDISMAELNGIEATRQIISKAPATRIVALTMHSERQFVTQMLEAGAAGYLLKDCAFEELAQAIHEVVKGRAYLSARIAGVIVNDVFRARGTAHADRCALSPREREVLQLIAEGRSTQGIAATLGISAKTVETHRSNVMDKLKIRSISGLTKYAIREGLTSVDQ